MPPVLGSTPPQLRLRPTGAEPEFDLDSPRLIVAGYTGRDADAVAEHIAELAAIGIPPPPTVPAFYEMDAGLLTTDPIVDISGSNTSGEVEPVLIRHHDTYYLGVGSDHTDRDLERADIAGSKAACPKPVCPQVIALPADLHALDWDSILAESQVDGAAYQRGHLTALRTPTDLLTRLVDALGQLDGDLVMFTGTLPLLGGEFIAGTHWQLRLSINPGTTLTHSYQVKRSTP